MSLVCPKCESEDIGQYRQMTGAIWCHGCGFRAPKKEIDNPFSKRNRKEN